MASVSQFEAANAQRRRSLRQTIKAVLFVNLEGMHPALVLDLSETGMGILSAAPLKDGTEVRCVLELAERAMTLQGVVVNSNASRAGIKFLSPPEVTRQVLKEWLFNNALTGGTMAAQEMLAAEREEREELKANNSRSDRETESAEEVPELEEPPQVIEEASRAPELEDVPVLVTDSVLATLARLAHQGTECNGVAIALLKDNDMVCRGRAGELAPQVGEPLGTRYSNSFAGQCLRSGGTLVCQDTTCDSRVDPVICRGLGIASIAAMVVRSKGEIVGLLEAFASRPSAFDAGAVRFLEQVAELIGTATEREKHPAAASAPAQQPVVNVAPPQAMPRPVPIAVPAPTTSATLAAAAPSSSLEPPPAPATIPAVASAAAPAIVPAVTTKPSPVPPPAALFSKPPSPPAVAPVSEMTAVPPAASLPPAVPTTTAPSPAPRPIAVTSATPSSSVATAELSRTRTGSTAAAAAPARAPIPINSASVSASVAKPLATSVPAEPVLVPLAAPITPSPSTVIPIRREAEAASRARPAQPQFKVTQLETRTPWARYLVAALVVGALAAGGYYFVSTRRAATPPAETAQVTPAQTSAPATSQTAPGVQTQVAAAAQPATEPANTAPATAEPTTSLPAASTTSAPANKPTLKAASIAPAASAPSPAAKTPASSAPTVSTAGNDRAPSNPPAALALRAPAPENTSPKQETVAPPSIALSPSTPSLDAALAPVAPRPAAALLRASSGPQAPKLAVRVAPVYPDTARRMHVEGTVSLLLSVDAQGRVSEAKAGGGNPLLVAAAKDAVRGWRYEPARLNGLAVASTVQVSIVFKLQ